MYILIKTVKRFYAIFRNLLTTILYNFLTYTSLRHNNSLKYDLPPTVWGPSVGWFTVMNFFDDWHFFHNWYMDFVDMMMMNSMYFVWNMKYVVFTVK